MQKDCVYLCSLKKKYPTLLTPWTGPPGFSVHGFLQAKILEWVAMPSFRGSSQPRN